MQPGLTHVVTFPPGGSGVGLSLSHLGHVSPAVYSYTTPGGCDQLSLTLFDPPRKRTEALNPGRLVKAYRGGAVVWRGVLDEPTPSDTGWNVTAHGSGTLGADYLAIYSVSWGTGVFNDAVDQAISRGLNWIRSTNIGSVSGLWTGQQVDSGAQSISDLLNLGATKGGLTWQVTTGPGDRDVLTVFPLPSTPNRILIATSPVGQSIASGPDAVYLRYQSSADSGSTPATFALTSSVQQGVIDKTGRREEYADLSSAGMMTAGAAQGVGSAVLQRFTRAGFTDAFNVQYGQLTNMGGVPVDPGCFYQDGSSVMYCRALLSDFAFGGEVTRGPVQFLVGAYQWDDGALIAQITPFESIRHDFQSLMQAAIDAIPVRAQATHKKKKGK